jgi:hypothetical protein
MQTEKADSSHRSANSLFNESILRGNAMTNSFLSTLVIQQSEDAMSYTEVTAIGSTDLFISRHSEGQETKEFWINDQETIEQFRDFLNYAFPKKGGA